MNEKLDAMDENPDVIDERHPDVMDEKLDDAQLDAAKYAEVIARLALIETAAGLDMAIRAAIKECGYHVGMAAIRKDVTDAKKRMAAESGAQNDGGRSGTDEDEELLKLIEQLNKKHAFVRDDGKAVIFNEDRDVFGRKIYTKSTSRDFKEFYLNRPVRSKTGNGKVVTLGEAWLRSKARREYSGVVFDPSGNAADDKLNLWEGFAVEPRKGSWRRLQRHIWAVICRRDRRAFQYLMRWMASAVQHPDQQGGIAIILRGKQGSGKGIAWRALVHLFGQNGLHINQGAHLVGRFNGHLQGCVMLFADEAFFAGDKQHAGVLKALITEPTIVTEEKFRRAVKTPNFVHLVMASNEEWVIPAELDDRRFLVLDVSDERIGDLEYFAAIVRELESGGHEAMLHDLQRIKLENFEVAAVPKTEALKTQKEFSLKTPHRWWQAVLQRGYVFESKFGVEDFHKWHDTMVTETLFRSYEQYARERGERHRLTQRQVALFLRSVGGRPVRIKAKGICPVRECMRHGEAVCHRNEKDDHGYKFGTLDEAREHFIKATGLPNKWDGDDAEDYTPDPEQVPTLELEIM